MSSRTQRRKSTIYCHPEYNEEKAQYGKAQVQHRTQYKLYTLTLLICHPKNNVAKAQYTHGHPEHNLEKAQYIVIPNTT